MENGRRYQAVREGEYGGASDEKQLWSLESFCHHQSLTRLNSWNLSRLDMSSIHFSMPTERIPSFVALSRTQHNIFSISELVLETGLSRLLIFIPMLSIREQSPMYKNKDCI